MDRNSRKCSGRTAPAWERTGAAASRACCRSSAPPGRDAYPEAAWRRLARRGLACEGGVAQGGERRARGDRLGVEAKLDDGGGAGSERAREGGGELGGLAHRLAMGAEGARIGGEIGVAQLGCWIAVGVLALLIHADRAVEPVIDDEEDDIGAVLNGGRQLLPGHPESAIAVAAAD